ncbi:MAG TPA: hypothetical protein VF681_11520 [Abditibacteriaceae bacterium]|jgi:ABC-type uncharacterized transport system auxiliary subunit
MRIKHYVRVAPYMVALTMSICLSGCSSSQDAKRVTGAHPSTATIKDEINKVESDKLLSADQKRLRIEQLQRVPMKK